MKLVRELGNFPQVHTGPVPGGTFWALAVHNDLPGTSPQMEADLEYLLRVGRVWVQDAGRPDSWVEVTAVNVLPRFTSTMREDCHACTTQVVVIPFLPEFYFWPKNWRGRRFLRRAVARAK